MTVPSVSSLFITGKINLK